MAISLPPLPFDQGSLAPYMSERTLDFHYGKHHKAYVDKTNELIRGTSYDSMSHEEIILASHGNTPKVFNNSAQAWNHTFFWNCLSGSKREPSVDIKDRLSEDFGSFDEFKGAFTTQAVALFGSGWAWLVKDKRGHLKIRALGNAGTPICDGEIPILVCDVWEHAYYLDYQNARPKFLNNFWNIVNWSFVESNLNKHSIESILGPRESLSGSATV